MKFRKSECAEWSKSVNAPEQDFAKEISLRRYIVVGKSVPLPPSDRFARAPQICDATQNSVSSFPIREVTRKRSRSLYILRRGVTRHDFTRAILILWRIFGYFSEYSLRFYSNIFDRRRWNYCGEKKNFVDIYSARFRENKRETTRIKDLRTFKFLMYVNFQLVTPISQLSCLKISSPSLGSQLLTYNFHLSARVSSQLSIRKINELCRGYNVLLKFFSTSIKIFV